MSIRLQDHQHGGSNNGTSNINDDSNHIYNTTTKSILRHKTLLFFIVSMLLFFVKYDMMNFKFGSSYYYDTVKVQDKEEGQMNVSLPTVRIYKKNKKNNNSDDTTTAITLGVLDDDPITKMEKKRGMLYTCGYPLIEFAKLLFPDYEVLDDGDGDGDGDNDGESKYTYHLEAKSSNDILVVGMHGDCANKGRSIAHNQYSDIQETFLGKALIVDGESNGNIIIDHPSGYSKLYQIGGPVRNTNHTMVGYFGIFALLALQPMERVQWIIDPTKKPINNGHRNKIAFFVSNCEISNRLQAVRQLAPIVPVETLGSCTVQNHPNVTKHKISDDFPQYQIGNQHHHDNWLVFHEYKYCLVMENKNQVGYITEKIVWAFLGGCVPIYYGTNEVFDVFNSNAFLYYDVNDKISQKKLLQEIQYLEQNHTAYQEKLLSEPILADGEQTLHDYFSYSDGIGNGYIKHQIRSMMGID